MHACRGCPLKPPSSGVRTRLLQALGRTTSCMHEHDRQLQAHSRDLQACKLQVYVHFSHLVSGRCYACFSSYVRGIRVPRTPVASVIQHPPYPAVTLCMLRRLWPRAGAAVGPMHVNVTLLYVGSRSWPVQLCIRADSFETSSAFATSISAAFLLFFFLERPAMSALAAAPLSS